MDFLFLAVYVHRFCSGLALFWPCEKPVADGEHQLLIFWFSYIQNEWSFCMTMYTVMNTDIRDVGKIQFKNTCPDLNVNGKGDMSALSAMQSRLRATH